MLAVLRKVYNSYWLFLATVIGFTFPYFLLGENSYLSVLDNLDGNVAIYKTLIANQGVFSSNDFQVDGMIGIQPRAIYPSEWNIVFLLTYILGSWFGYLANFFIIHILAFIGISALFQYIKRNTNILIGCPDYLLGLFSVFFATIKFWPHAGLSAAGLPILLLGILLINRRRKNIVGYLLVLLYIFYSNLVIGGLFSLVAYFVYIFYLMMSGNRRSALFNFIVLVGMGLLYVLIEYRLFLAIFQNVNFVSHRSESDFSRFAIKSDVVWSALKDLVMNGQMHAGNYAKGAFLYCLFGIVLLAFKRLTIQQTKLLIVGIITFIVILILSILLNGHLIVKSFQQFPTIKLIQLDRFYFLIPTVLTILMLYVSYLLYKKYVYLTFRIGVTAVLIYLIGLNLGLDDNWNNWAKQNLLGEVRLPTYKSFYAKDQFSEIKNHLKESSYNGRIASMGIHPAVAVMNGIPVVDGYLSSYKLESKHGIKKVIQAEIAKDPFMESYFNHWGHRAYLFNNVHKRDFMQYRDRVDYQPVNARLDYDYQALKELGCSYIISAVPINTDINSQLNLDRTFYSMLSAWTIYLYSIAD